MVLSPCTFSKEQEEYLLGFLKASFTPVAEILSERIIKLENDLEIAMRKLNDHSLLVDSMRLPMDFQAYVPSEGDEPWLGCDAAAPHERMRSVVSDVGHVLNADATEFVPPAIPPPCPPPSTPARAHHTLHGCSLSRFLRTDRLVNVYQFEPNETVKNETVRNETKRISIY